MQLTALKATTHFNKWRDGKTGRSLRFSVIPTDFHYLEIGKDYVFSSAQNHRTTARDRSKVDAGVSFTADPEILENIRPTFAGHPRVEGLIGWVSFHREGRPGYGYTPPLLNFTIVVEPATLDDLCRLSHFEPGALTIDLWIDGLDYGWEPDGSHTVWKLDDENRGQLPITSFSCAIVTHRTTETEIFEATERHDTAVLAESHDPGERDLAKQLQGARQVPPIERYVKEARYLLIMIFLALLVLLAR